MAEDNKRQEELLELLKRQTEESDKQAEYLDRRNKSIASAIEQYKTLLEQATTASAKRDYELKISELIEASAENRLETLEEEQKALNEKIENLEKILDDEEEMAKLGKERADTLRKSVELLKQERAVLDQTVPLEKRKKDLRDSGKQASENTLNTLSGILGMEREISNTVSGRIANIMSEQESQDAFFENITGGLKEMMNPAVVGEAMLKKFAEMSIVLTLALDNLQSEFNLATSAGGKFNDQLGDLLNSSIGTYVSFQNLGAVAADLTNNLGALQGQSAEALMDNKELQLSLGTLAELGMTAEQTSQMMMTFVGAFNMTSAEAEQLTMNMAGLSQETGASIQQIGQDLQRLMPRLQAFGKDSVKIFANLERQAKATGASIDELANISLRFADSFQDSTTAAAQLNAMFGTSVDGMELFTRAASGDTTGALNMLRSQLQAAGNDVSNMSFTELSSMAKILGTDVDTVQKAFKGGIFPDGGDPQGRTREEFQEMLKSSQTLMSNLKELGMSFGVALKPILPVLNDVVQGFTSILNAGGIMPKILLGVVAPLFMIYKGITSLYGGFTNIMTAIRGVTAQMRQMTAEVMRFNTASRSGGAPMIGPVQQGGGKGAPPAVSPAGLKTASKGMKMAKGAGYGAITGLLSIATSLMAGDPIDGKMVGGVLGGIIGGAIGALIPIPGMAFIGAILGDMAGRALFHDGGGVGGSGEVPATLKTGEAVVPINSTPAAANFSGMVADTVMTNFAAQQAAAQAAQKNINVAFDKSAKVVFDGGQLQAIIGTEVKNTLNGKNQMNGPSKSLKI